MNEIQAPADWVRRRGRGGVLGTSFRAGERASYFLPISTSSTRGGEIGNCVTRTPVAR